MAQDHSDTVHQVVQGATPRERLKHGMDAVLDYLHRTGRVHYSQVQGKRMTIVRLHLVPPFGRVVLYEDCSSMVTGLYRMAGLHDPNDLHFSGYGFTGTLAEHGQRVQGPPVVGDLVFYGHGAPYEHVTMIYSNGHVFSHGHEGGPLILPIDYRGDRQVIRRYVPWRPE